MPNEAILVAEEADFDVTNFNFYQEKTQDVSWYQHNPWSMQSCRQQSVVVTNFLPDISALLQIDRCVFDSQKLDKRIDDICSSNHGVRCAPMIQPAGVKLGVDLQNTQCHIYVDTHKHVRAE